MLLSDRMQQIIADITRRMGAGMAEFASKDLKDVVSKRDYDQVRASKAISFIHCVLMVVERER